MVSDETPAPEAASRVVRLWWNDATEIQHFAERNPAARRDLHVSWFSQAAAVDQDLDVRTVPYAFAPIRRLAGGRLSAVFFAGEVETASDRLAAVSGWDESVVRRAASTAAEMANAVAGGCATFSDAAAHFEVAYGQRHVPDLVWMTRNLVRMELIRGARHTFPGRVVLRGSDWQRLGLPARRTNHFRAIRLAEYRLHACLLDLGSKSSDHPLYPRSAEILGLGGGLVQFNPGPRTTHLIPHDRTASSAEELYSQVDALLAMSRRTRREANRVLQETYSAERQRSAMALLREVTYDL